QVNRHAPGIRLRLVVVRRIESLVLLRLVLVEAGVSFFLIFLQRFRADKRALGVADIHRLVTLRAGEDIRPGNLFDLHAGCEPWSSAITQGIDVKANIVTRAADTLAAIAEKNGD